MSKEDKLFISFYNDYYGNLLTKQQKEIIDLYYNHDFTLQEIAQEFNITRQAVRDSLQRAEAALVDYEEKLKFYKRDEEILNELNAMINNANCADIKNKIDNVIKIIEE